MEVSYKPERPRIEWVDDVKGWCNMDIYSVALEQCRTENCGQQLREQHWTPEGALAPLLTSV